MKFLLIVIIFIYTVPQNLFGQSFQKPKLIVSIVVDQMRAEYLYRFQDNYTENGFKRLICEASMLKMVGYWIVIPWYFGAVNTKKAGNQNCKSSVVGI